MTVTVMMTADFQLALYGGVTCPHLSHLRRKHLLLVTTMQHHRHKSAGGLNHTSEKL